MVLVEGVAFAVGLLLVAVSMYLMAVEAIRKSKRSQQGFPCNDSRCRTGFLGAKHSDVRVGKRRRCPLMV